MRVRWLLAGALRAELIPFARRLDAPRPAGRRLVVGRLAGAPVALLRTGVGPERAGRRLAGALAALRPEAVLNVGTAGALVDALPVGAVRAVTGLHEGPRPLAALPAWPGLPAARLATVTEPVWEPARRRVLAGAGADLVDMEAAGLWRVVREHGGAVFFVVKVASDAAGADPEDPVGPPTGPAGPARVLRFKARALRLVERGLVPAVLPHLGGPPWYAHPGPDAHGGA